MELLFYILAGAGVGFAVGLTGIGGGSIMTPLLILWGIDPKVAIGTDLLYAAATKSNAVVTHHRQGTIHWRLVLLLAAGSIPTSILTSYIIKYYLAEIDYSPLLTHSLGYMLIVTSIVVFFRRQIQSHPSLSEPESSWFYRNTDKFTFAAGIVLGILVTLSSVGAGAFCAALLLTLYPKLPALHIVGTDIAHAVPLTLIAGTGHLWNGNVDFVLLAGLLLGSLPAVHFASKLATKIPDTVLQPILATILMVIGVKFAFFPAVGH